MSHIFGIAHSFGGILDQIGNVFQPNTAPPPPPLGFFPGYVSPNAFVPPPGGMMPPGNGGGIDDEFGGSYLNGNNNGGPCAPCPKIKRFITTVCPDGTTSTREAKSRKRKRRLATVSDIKDLAALKSILGGGKTFETWIATRGR